MKQVRLLPGHESGNGFNLAASGTEQVQNDMGLEGQLI
jgi:hypothetical protein